MCKPQIQSHFKVIKLKCKETEKRRREGKKKKKKTYSKEKKNYDEIC